MIVPEIPDNEPERLAGLQALRILDTAAEERFDRFTRMGARAFDVPICLVSLVDANRQWFKSKAGLDAPETPRDVSFCGHAVLEGKPLVVPDSHADPRFADNPLVTGEPHVRFYAGHPLRDRAGRPLGTFCLIDTRPREVQPEQLELLADFATLVELELNSGGLEAALSLANQSEELQRSVIGALEEGVLVISADGLIEEANQSAADILRLELEEIVGRNLGDLSTIPEFQWVGEDMQPLPPANRPILRTLAHGETVSGQVVGLCATAGDVIWLSVNSTPIGPVAGGTPERVVLSFSDITHRLEVDRVKDEFVSVVSHELRTPLTSIRGALGLLASGHLGALNPDGTRMVDIAVSNTDRLIRLINDILDIERIQSGNLTLCRGDVELASVIEQSLSIVQPLADAESVSLVERVDPVRVWVDADRIVQALTNLLSNAIKFSEPGSRVVVETEVNDGQVTIHVTDSGRGIPANRCEAIFERFQQVDASDSREKGGTGLGLAISRQIVEQHGGTISVSSQLGEGSTFSIVVPGVLAQRHDRHPGGTEPAKPHLLLVEDDADLAAVLVEIFRGSGATIDHAGTVVDALASARATAPDLIVLDVALPGASGFELIDALRRHDVLRTTAVVVYSAQDFHEADRQRLRLGPTRFLTKSLVTPAAFSDHVLGLLATKAAPAPA